MHSKFFTLCVFLWIAGLMLSMSLDSPALAWLAFAILGAGRLKLWRDTRRGRDV